MNSKCWVYIKVRSTDEKKIDYISPNTVGKFNLFHCHKLQKWYAVCWHATIRNPSENMTLYMIILHLICSMIKPRENHVWGGYNSACLMKSSTFQEMYSWLLWIVLLLVLPYPPSVDYLRPVTMLHTFEKKVSFLTIESNLFKTP